MSRLNKGQTTPLDLLLVTIVFFIGFGIFMILNLSAVEQMIVSRSTIQLNMEVDDRGSEIVALMNAKHGDRTYMEIAGNTEPANYRDYVQADADALEAETSKISSLRLSLPGSDSPSETRVSCFSHDTDSPPKGMLWPGGANPGKEGRRITSLPGLRDIDYRGCVCHNGVDVGGKFDIIAAAPGKIMFLSTNVQGYGRTIIIQHSGDYSGYFTFYGHLESFASGIKQGAEVKANTLLGISGHSGLSYGDHLHFELHKGTPDNRVKLNPCLYISNPPEGCFVKDRCDKFEDHGVVENIYKFQIPLPGVREEGLRKTISLVL